MFLSDADADCDEPAEDAIDAMRFRICQSQKARLLDEGCLKPLRNLSTDCHCNSNAGVCGQSLEPIACQTRERCYLFCQPRSQLGYVTAKRTKAVMVEPPVMDVTIAKRSARAAVGGSQPCSSSRLRVR